MLTRRLHWLVAPRPACGVMAGTTIVFPRFRARSAHEAPNWALALLVVISAVAGLVTYHLVTSDPASPVGRCRPRAGQRAQGRPHAPGRHEHPGGAPRLIRRGDLGDGGGRGLLGRPGRTGRRDDLPGHHRPGCLEDLDATAGSHPAARQPWRGHADRRRQDPQRARFAAGHAEPGTRSGKFRVAPAQRSPAAGCPARRLPVPGSAPAGSAGHVRPGCCSGGSAARTGSASC